MSFCIVSVADVAAPPLPIRAMSTPTVNPKDQFLQFYQRESDTTLKVLRAFPKEQGEFKPHEKSNSARQLAATFCIEQRLMLLALKNELNLGAGFPKTPDTWDETVALFERERDELVGLVKSLPEEQLFENTKFYVAPKTVGDIPKLQFLWFMGCDQIHHRGQMSVYLRMAGGKVPSIYGPSHDEPWN